jgi:hypothetical protein
MKPLLLSSIRRHKGSERLIKSSSDLDLADPKLVMLSPPDTLITGASGDAGNFLSRPSERPLRGSKKRWQRFNSSTGRSFSAALDDFNTPTVTAARVCALERAATARV